MRISRTHLFIAAGVAVLLVAVAAFAGQTREVSEPSIVPEALPQAATSSPVKSESEGEEEVPRTAIVRDTPPTATTVALKSAAPVGTATLVVESTRYTLTAPAGSTLKEALDRLQSESTFTYQYRDYAGLGAFVTHINGRASGSDHYWILYVNGEKSATGISATRIRSNDVIEWKLEESY